VKEEIDEKYQQLSTQFDELKLKNTTDLLSFTTLYDEKIGSLKDQWNLLSQQQLLLERENKAEEEKKTIEQQPLLLSSAAGSALMEREFLEKVKDELQISYNALSTKVDQLELLQKQYQVSFFLYDLSLILSYCCFVSLRQTDGNHPKGYFHK
jgi:hypothetical protein